ncbi:GIY-YIG nuclease family protein [Patescibacteria group bacterium]|nr:GIY-YIG nuclease family protein [Patescibacteria group bacterium]
MYFLYLLECADGTIYTGITTDVTRRIEEHKNGIGSRYTRSRKVKRLLYTERQKNRSTASKREAEVKKMTRKAKLALARPS